MKQTAPAVAQTFRSVGTIDLEEFRDALQTFDVGLTGQQCASLFKKLAGADGEIPVVAFTSWLEGKGEHGVLEDMATKRLSHLMQVHLGSSNVAFAFMCAANKPAKQKLAKKQPSVRTSTNSKQQWQQPVGGAVGGSQFIGAEHKGKLLNHLQFVTGVRQLCALSKEAIMPSRQECTAVFIRAGGAVTGGRTTTALTASQFDAHFRRMVGGGLPQHEPEQKLPLEVAFIARHGAAILHAAKRARSAKTAQLVAEEEFMRAANTLQVRLRAAVSALAGLMSTLSAWSAHSGCVASATAASAVDRSGLGAARPHRGGSCGDDRAAGMGRCCRRWERLG